MRAIRTKTMQAGLALSLAAGMCALGSGCGKTETPAPAAAKKSSSAAAKPAPTPAPSAGDSETNRLGRPIEFLSAFSTNDPRDPFNPKAKAQAATAAQAAAKAESEAEQITKALQSSVSVWGVPGNLVAVVHGVLLEEKKENIVPLTVSGTARRLKVKPVKISTTQVQLQVEGVPQVVTLQNAR